MSSSSCSCRICRSWIRSSSSIANPNDPAQTHRLARVALFPVIVVISPAGAEFTGGGIHPGLQLSGSSGDTEYKINVNAYAFPRQRLNCSGAL